MTCVASELFYKLYWNTRWWAFASCWGVLHTYCSQRWTNVAYTTDRLFCIVRLRDVIIEIYKEVLRNCLTWFLGMWRHVSNFSRATSIEMPYPCNLPFGLSPAQSLMSGSHGRMSVILAPIFYLGRTFTGSCTTDIVTNCCYWLSHRFECSSQKAVTFSVLRTRWVHAVEKERPVGLWPCFELHALTLLVIHDEGKLLCNPLHSTVIPRPTLAFTIWPIWSLKLSWKA